MSATQLQRMDEVEIWRAKAYAFSRVDRLGRLLTRSFELIQAVVTDGPACESLPSVIESLIKENTKAMIDDDMKDEVLRSMLYGLNISMASMIESIIERFEEYSGESYARLFAMDQETSVKTEEPDDYDDSPNYDLGNFDANQSAIVDDDLFLNTVKEEYTDEPTTSGMPVLDFFSPNGELPSASTEAQAEFSDEEEGKFDTYGNITGFSHKRRRSSRLPKEEEKAKISRYVEEDEEDDDDYQSASDADSELFSCRKCDKKFETEWALTRHIYVHNAHRCQECGMRIKREDINKHYTQLHPGKTPSKSENEVESKKWTLKCEICDRKFKFPFQLERHVRIHSGKKPFVCSKCPSAYNRSDLLKQHLRRAHGENLYECEECDAKFHAKIDLRVHVKNHRENSEVS